MGILQAASAGTAGGTIVFANPFSAKVSRAGAGEEPVALGMDQSTQNLMLSELRNIGNVLQQVGQTMQAIQRNTIDEAKEAEGTMGYL